MPPTKPDRTRRLAAMSEPERLFLQAAGLQFLGDLPAAAQAYAAVQGLGELLAQPAGDAPPVRGPDFIVIGAARSGTTWLKDVLKQHPQVAMGLGEPRYFCARLNEPPTAYVAELAAVAANKPERQVVGEKSPEYLAMSDERIALCAALFPEVRLVCLIRDPVERAWSAINHLHRGRVLDGRWTDPAAWSERGAGAKAGFPELRDVLVLRRHLEEARYERHLRRWAAHFPPDRFLLIDFSRLAAEPEAVQAEVLAHLGVSSQALPEGLEGREPAAGPPPEVAAALARYYDGDRTAPAALSASMAEARALADAGQADPQQGPAPSDEPEKLWRWLLQLIPGNARAHAELALLLAQKGESAGVLAHLVVLAKIRPTDPVIWRCLGLIARQGDFAREVRALRAFAKAAPRSPELRPRLIGLLQARRDEGLAARRPLPSSPEG